MKKSLLFGAVVALALLAGIALGLSRASGPARADLPAGGDFVLQSADGVIDSRDWRGKVVLLYFGYTHCPDVCPASMAAGAQALRTLSGEERGRVRLLLVSVDPERDTPAHLKDYAAFFHPEMVGATAAPEEIARLAKAYGAGYVRQASAADGTYAVDHTTATYVIDPAGKLSDVIELGAGGDRIASTIRSLL